MKILFIFAFVTIKTIIIMNEDEEYFQSVDKELIDEDFDHIDPYGEIMDDGSNGEHNFDDIEL